MSYYYNFKKYGADKIFLLAMFAFSLLIASWIVKTKKAIILGPPVEMPHLGLSIAMPSGNGWQSDASWKTHQGALVLSSRFQPIPQLTLAGVVCTYRSASTRNSAQTWLESKTAERNAENTQWGTTKTKTGILQWVHIKDVNNMTGMIIATTEMTQGRWLDIEITQIMYENDMAREILDKMAEHIETADSELLTTGMKTVSELKSAGLARKIENPDEPYYYLIKNSSRENIGLAIDILRSSKNSNNSRIQATGFAYVRSPSPWETATFFRSDNNLNEVVWQSETKYGKEVLTITGRRTVSTRRDIVEETNRITITDGNLLSAQRIGPKTTEYEMIISRAAIPNTVLEALYLRMLDTNVEKLVADIISSEGDAEPALITAKKTPDNVPDAKYIVTVEYIGRENSEEIFLDDQMRIVRQIIRHNSVIVLDRSALEELMRLFPERADYIRQRNQTIMEEILQQN